MEVVADIMEPVGELIKQTVASTVRNEEWKYTNVQFLNRDQYTVQNRLPIDGAQFSSRIAVESPTDNIINPFTKLTHRISDGIHTIVIPKNTVVERPVILEIFANCSSENVVQANRIKVVVEEGASIRFVEQHQVDGEMAFFDLIDVEFEVGENASVEYIKVIDTEGVIRQFGDTRARVGRNARFSSFAISIDGTFIRNDLRVSLIGEGASAYLYGVSVLNASQLTDNHTIVDHEVAGCHSEELYKGTYDEKSIGVFNGKIYVRPGAQKSTAYQSCKSILLSERSQVNVKPQLEIWADDVKCSHGAATGKLDEEALFYLRTRGLTDEDARGLITYAHVAEVVEHISDETLRISIMRRVAQKIGTNR